MHRRPLGKLKAAAAAFYSRIPSDAELEKTGYTREDFDQECEVWEENVPVFQLFCGLQTQWHVMSGGAGAARTGLNHLVVLALLDRMELSKEEYWNMYSDVQVLELAALEEMNDSQG